MSLAPVVSASVSARPFVMSGMNVLMPWGGGP